MGLVSADLTRFSASDLLAELALAYRRELGGTPTSSTLCILAAQVCLETAGGARCVQWNVGNFKAPTTGLGDYCYFTTVEYDGAGVPHVLRPPDPGCRFRAYASLEEGLEAYLDAMMTRWRLAWHEALVGTPESFAASLRAQGYYTAPVDAYAKGVRSWFGHLIELAALAPDATTPAPPDVPLVLGYVSPELIISTPNTDTDPTVPPSGSA